MTSSAPLQKCAQIAKSRTKHDPVGHAPKVLLKTQIPFSHKSSAELMNWHTVRWQGLIFHKKSETFSLNITVQNNKYCKWQTKWTSSSSELREDSPREMKGEKDIDESTKVVQCRYLHLTRGLKTEGYLQTGGWSKPGQTTPTEQHKKTNEKEQVNSMSVTESLK